MRILLGRFVGVLPQMATPEHADIPVQSCFQVPQVPTDHGNRSETSRFLSIFGSNFVAIREIIDGDA
jgi:hypothetical protein